MKTLICPNCGKELRYVEYDKESVSEVEVDCPHCGYYESFSWDKSGECIPDSLEVGISKILLNKHLTKRQFKKLLRKLCEGEL